MCRAGWEESSRARRLLLYTSLPPPGNAPGACETARRWVKGKGWEGRERQTCLTYLFKPTAGGADYSCRAKQCVCVGTNIHISSPSSLSPSLCCRYNQTEEQAWAVCLLICPTHPPLHRPAPLPSKSPRRRSSPVAGQSLTTRHLWWDSNPGHKKIKLHRLFQSKEF